MVRPIVRHAGGRARMPVAAVCLAAAAMIALSCRDAPQPGSEVAEEPGIVRIDPPAGEGAMAPFLAASHDGLLMTWLEPSESGTVSFMLSRWGGGARGSAWSAPVVITRGDDLFANWADVPSVVQAGDGSLLAHWLAKSGEGTYAYDIRVARSTDGGATWEPLGKANDDAIAAEHGFVSMLPEAQGARMFWLDGRETAHEGPMTLRTCLVTDHVASSVLLDERVCDCCRTGAAVVAGRPVLVYRDRAEGEIRDISLVRRTGSGWSEPGPVHADGWVVPGCPVNGPAVAGRADGDDLAVAWYTAEGNRPRVQVAFSDDAGARFSDPVLVDDAAPPGRVDLIRGHEGEALVSWVAAGDGEEARLLIRRVRRDGRMGAPLAVAGVSRARASGFPRMARAGDRLAIAWTDAGDTTRLRGALVSPTAIPAVGEEAAASPGGGAAAPGIWGGNVGDEAPEYAAASLDGGRLALRDLRGRPFLLNFWATWCLPCRRELPALIALREEHAGAGLRIVGVSLDTAREEDEVRRFAREEMIPYTVLLDPDERATDLFGLTTLPASYLFDAGGRLVWKRTGIIERDDVGLKEALGALSGPER